MDKFIAIVHQNIALMDPNNFELLKAIISGVITLAIAYIGITATFKQLQKQFEHKIIYEGWFDLQQKLFVFSSSLTDYQMEILNLLSFIENQNNNLLNRGNKQQYRFDYWQSTIGKFETLQKNYVEFLKAYENHEVIFLELKNMKTIFCEVFSTNVNETQIDFFEKIFPEIYGSTKQTSDLELKKSIKEYWNKIIDVSVYLGDFRVELQNITVGSVIKKKVSYRVPLKKGNKILTRKGFIDC